MSPGGDEPGIIFPALFPAMIVPMILSYYDVFSPSPIS